MIFSKLDFQSVILKRRMVRHFANDPVPDKVIDRILELAQHSPSAGFSQGVAYVVVRDEEMRKKIGMVQGEDRYVSLFHYPFISEAPVVIVVSTSEEVYRKRYNEPDKRRGDGSVMDWPNPFWFFDAGAASMTILLAAVDLGYAAAFTGVSDLDGMRTLLKIPDDYQPVGTISIGKPLKDFKSPSLKRGRRAFNEVVHREYW